MTDFKQEGKRLWFSLDGVWGVYKTITHDDYLLYKQGEDKYYDFTGFDFPDWLEIQRYIKNHE